MSLAIRPCKDRADLLSALHASQGPHGGTYRLRAEIHAARPPAHRSPAQRYRVVWPYAFQASSDLGKHSRYAGQLMRSGPPASVDMRADCHPVRHPSR
jgi:hypothetical protein